MTKSGLLIAPHYLGKATIDRWIFLQLFFFGRETGNGSKNPMQRYFGVGIWIVIMQKPARYTAAVRRHMADEDQLGQVQRIRGNNQRGASLQLASERLQRLSQVGSDNWGGSLLLTCTPAIGELEWNSNLNLWGHNHKQPSMCKHFREWEALNHYQLQINHHDHRWHS